MYFWLEVESRTHYGVLCGYSYRVGVLAGIVGGGLKLGSTRQAKPGNEGAVSVLFISFVRLLQLTSITRYCWLTCLPTDNEWRYEMGALMVQAPAQVKASTSPRVHHRFSLFPL